MTFLFAVLIVWLLLRERKHRREILKQHLVVLDLIDSLNDQDKLLMELIEGLQPADEYVVSLN